MQAYQFIFGPVPSRRMGLSLGVSPIPDNHCNYSCVYCQLGRTTSMQGHRELYFPVDAILQEAADYLQAGLPFDVVSVVGEGEPTLYAGLGELLAGLKQLTDQPVAVITNGSLLGDAAVRRELAQADLVLPSMDAFDQASFKKINRPHGKIHFDQVYQGLVDFSQAYQGQLWLEIMLVQGINDDEASLMKLKKLLKAVKYDRLFINAPVRPPAEVWVKEPEVDALNRAVELLGGIAISTAATPEFYSDVPDDYEAIVSIIKRHPMNQHEINSFLTDRQCQDAAGVFARLQANPLVQRVDYKGYQTYRIG